MLNYPIYILESIYFINIKCETHFEFNNARHILQLIKLYLKTDLQAH